ncbi:MAG: zinc-dependent alcohol dehydrogenase family protein [Deltaproteobacteria bacterium]|nr:zinc-dependent alcohol dehydrogenase family protein [Deltaproteobacteria bacterium]
MKAMVLNGVSSFQDTKAPLEMTDLPDPVPGEGEILIRVSACGVCHTELDEIEGRTPPPRFPVVLGHEVVGRVAGAGKGTTRFQTGDRVGIGWIHSACGKCTYCLSGNENVCEQFRGTGRDADGGYAEYMTVSESFAYPIPELFTDAQAAPLMCAGAIGYRSLRLANIEDGQNLGLTGFGASAHLVLTMARHIYPNSQIFVFARSEREQAFARELGALWAGGTEDQAPEKLHSIIDTTPAWRPIVEALKNLECGGRLVINAIRKEDADKDYLLKIDYPAHLWLEKEIKSVANVARRDISEFLQLAAEIPIRPHVQEFPLEEANRALCELKEGKIRGGKVLRIV